MARFFNSFNPLVDPTIEALFEVAVNRLAKKISNFNCSKANVSEYYKTYFKDYQRKLDYSLKACSFILMNALKDNTKNISELTIVDYGAGTGVLAMLAKEVGFGKVIYSDIYDVSCIDAKEVASQLGVAADAYVAGDIQDLKQFFETKNTLCDIIVSRNVIEHIYDLDTYFKTLVQIPSNNLTLFFATTANIKNPLTVWYTKRIQRMLEFKGMTNKWGKERDAIKPYLQIRLDIINEYAPHLDHQIAADFAMRTRGTTKKEITNSIDSFLKSGQKPTPLKHPTNTCDPYTGNWAEHLVEMETYKNLFTSNNFSFKIENGFYNVNYASKWINLITPFVNRLIKIWPKKGIYLAPFIGLKGVQIGKTKIK